MKLKSLFCLLLTLTVIFALASCQLIGGAKNKKFTVEFKNGETVVDAQTVTQGSTLTKPQDPTKEGYTFDGWYNGDEKWNFDEDTVNGALNLIAKYKETKRKYTISFNIIGNDNLSLGSVEVEYGQIFDLSKVLEGVDVSGYTYSFTIGGLEKINFKVVEDVTVDVSFTQLVEDAKEKIGCFSGIGSGVTGIALAAAVAFALKKKKED